MPNKVFAYAVKAIKNEINKQHGKDNMFLIDKLVNRLSDDLYPDDLVMKKKMKNAVLAELD